MHTNEGACGFDDVHALRNRVALPVPRYDFDTAFGPHIPTRFASRARCVTIEYQLTNRYMVRTLEEMHVSRVWIEKTGFSTSGPFLFRKFAKPHRPGRAARRMPQYYFTHSIN